MKLPRFLLVLILPLAFFTGCTTLYAQGAFPVSADTKFFMMDLQNEMNTSKQPLKTFNPSTQLIKKYSLQKIKGIYYVSGFIKTDKNFSEKQLKKIKTFPGQPSGDIRTILVPLSAFSTFLNQKGITYFELSKKLEIN
ncbi:MAG: hypothetical protein JST82_00190 [Bacteroidetes bacterium]|nr:hypothetical protein [Bacteroidota bacterium]